MHDTRTDVRGRQCRRRNVVSVGRPCVVEVLDEAGTYPDRTVKRMIDQRRQGTGRGRRLADAGLMQQQRTQK